ncbi:MAG: Gfo/Idh/MocA family oxidoreductase, partial [Candidatus Nanopelagicaceae bacterium]|nr:Gfo/Idh/MocA family oxidoreductase [Candidatus Nanopelagicaceae bacterium]
MSVNWGFIGAGVVASKALAPAVRSASNANLYAVASRDISKATNLSPERVYDNYDELINDPKVDAIYISLPNNFHAPIASRALRSGKAVLCEKPLTMNYQESLELVEAAALSKSLLVEAIWYRWHPRLIKACQQIAAGVIGEIKEINAAFTYVNSNKGNYRFDPALGGGALLDLGPYPLHLIPSLFGSEARVELLTVNQEIGPSGVDLVTKVEALINGSIKFNFNVSFVGQLSQEISITGSNGGIKFLEGAAFTNWNEPSTLQVNDEIYSFESVDAYQLMVEAVSDVILGKPGWIPPHSESLFVMDLIDQIR